MQSRTTPDPEAVARRPFEWWPAVVCLGLYAVLAAFEFGHFDGLGPGTMTGPRAEDQVAQVWWLAWAQYGLAHGHNLFFTDWQNYPVGFNFGVNGSMLALGVVFSPITTVFGPVVTWNVLLRVAPIVSAFSMCLVLRRWARWWPAAFVGGLVYGFSAYMTFYANGYLFLTFVPIPPLIFLLLDEVLARQSWEPKRVGALLGLSCGVQYLIFPEVLASAVVIGAVGCALYVFFNRKSFTTKIAYLKKAFWASVVTAAIALGFPVMFTLVGPQHSKGAVGSPANLEQYHGDLLGFFAPSRFLYFRTSYFGSLWSQPLTASMYVGIPLAAAIVLTVYLLRSRGIIRLCATMLVFSSLLSMGTVLYVDGRNSHIPLPSVILANFPVTDGFQSTRFVLYTTLFGGAIVAMGLDELHRRLARSHRPYFIERWAITSRVTASVITLLLAAVVVLPMLPARVQPAAATAESMWFKTPQAATIPEGSVMLAYPYPNSPYVPASQALTSGGSQTTITNVLLDQAVSGMRFKVLGSYGWRPTHGLYESPRPSRLEPQSVQVLFNVAFSGTASPGQKKILESANLTHDVRVFLLRYQVETVVVLPLGRAPDLVNGVISAVIGKPSQVEGTAVWSGVQDRLKQESRQDVASAGIASHE